MEPLDRHPCSPSSASIAEAIDTLLSRRMADGGFAEIPGGDCRPDATAWAILCLKAFRTHPEIVSAARAKLAAAQLANGSIPLAPDYPEAFWPTAPAAMALHDATPFSAVHERAIGFLLATSGRQFIKEPDSPIGHDSMIPGWPWIAHNYPWVEPTAMAIRALTEAGNSSHERVRSGINLVLDRQLPGGGWNYGNTTVFEKTLRPMPDVTGMALWSLAGLADREQVSASLTLLEQQLPRLYTPLSLGWALQGLTAWNVDPPDADALIANCLQRQGRYGVYGTSQFGILLTAAAFYQPAGNGHV